MDDVSKSDAPEFTTRVEFAEWLKDKPREWSVVLAARVALRVLPIVSTAAPRKNNKFPDFLQLTSAAFRCTAIGLIAAKFATRPIDIADAANAANATVRATREAALAVNAARAAALAAALAASTNANADVTRAADVAVDAALAADAESTDAWSALSRDARFLAENDAPTALAAEPLWLSSAPDRAAIDWSELRDALPAGEHWEVWIDWYAERLKKSRWSLKKELIYASVPLAIWREGHVAANTWIYDELQKLKPPKKRNDERHYNNDRELVEQSPAPTSFRIVDEKIDAAPESEGAIDDTIAAAFYDEVKRKLRELRERLERAQADKRLQSNLALLDARLGASLADVSIGHLLPSLYSLERDFQVYNSEDGREEHSLELIAALGDAAGSLRDLVSLFPKVRQIEAEALALRIVQRPEIQKEIADEGRKAIRAASESPLITSAAESALKDTENSVTTARDADERARQLSYLVLDLTNFARASIVLGVKEVGGLAGECWRDIRNRTPARVGKLVALGVTLYGLSTLAEHLPLEKIKLLRDIGGIVEKLGNLIEDKPPPKASDKASTSEPNESTPPPKRDSRAASSNPPPHAEERPKGASRSTRGSSRARK